VVSRDQYVPVLRDTHLLEVGEGRITDQKCIVKDKAFGWILRANTGVNECQNGHLERQRTCGVIMTLSNASNRWVLLVTLLVYLGRSKESSGGCSDVSLASELAPTRESIKLPQGASTDMISALIDQSGAGGNRALVR
jgi:hypothetical protein